MGEKFPKQRCKAFKDCLVIFSSFQSWVKEEEEVEEEKKEGGMGRVTGEEISSSSTLHS